MSLNTKSSSFPFHINWIEFAICSHQFSKIKLNYNFSFLLSFVIYAWMRCFSSIYFAGATLPRKWNWFIFIQVVRKKCNFYSWMLSTLSVSLSFLYTFLFLSELASSQPSRKKRKFFFLLMRKLKVFPDLTHSTSCML